jgi:hypothetical protein
MEVVRASRSPVERAVRAVELEGPVDLICLITAVLVPDRYPEPDKTIVYLIICRVRFKTVVELSIARERAAAARSGTGQERPPIYSTPILKWIHHLRRSEPLSRRTRPVHHDRQDRIEWARSDRDEDAQPSELYARCSQGTDATRSVVDPRIARASREVYECLKDHS